MEPQTETEKVEVKSLRIIDSLKNEIDKLKQRQETQAEAELLKQLEQDLISNPNAASAMNMHFETISASAEARVRDYGEGIDYAWQYVNGILPQKSSNERFRIRGGYGDEKAFVSIALAPGKPLKASNEPYPQYLDHVTDNHLMPISQEIYTDKNEQALHVSKVLYDLVKNIYTKEIKSKLDLHPNL